MSLVTIVLKKLKNVFAWGVRRMGGKMPIYYIKESSWPKSQEEWLCIAVKEKDFERINLLKQQGWERKTRHRILEIINVLNEHSKDENVNFQLPDVVVSYFHPVFVDNGCPPPEKIYRKPHRRSHKKASSGKYNFPAGYYK